MPHQYNPAYRKFFLRRVRLEFRTLQTQRFPEGKAGNIFRGALGWALRQSDPQAYTEFFEPRRTPGLGPSGFADPPRPFVLRAGHLEGRTFQTGDCFAVDLLLFRQTAPEIFIRAMECIPVGQLHGWTVEDLAIPLENRNAGIHRLTVNFTSPTELKTQGSLAASPDFPILFSRARDRVRAMSADDLELDFAGMAQRAQVISLEGHRLRYQNRLRTSSKTGQTHPIGGFLGEADYAGNLDEFLPLLEAASWTGVGRQTVWGKGQIWLLY
jgi:hypothetical protein